MTSVGAGRRWVTVVGVGGVLALVGCSDGGAVEPTVAPSTATSSPEPTATVSPSPTVTEPGGLAPPERPAAMANGDEAGAQAAAEYFVELYGYAVQSQDLADFSAVCDEASEFCSSVIDSVTADVESEIRTEGGGATLSVTQIDVPGAHPFYTVWGAVDRDPFVARGADGVPVFESEGESELGFAIGVEFTEGGWIVRAAKSGIEPGA